MTLESRPLQAQTSQDKADINLKGEARSSRFWIRFLAIVGLALWFFAGHDMPELRGLIVLCAIGAAALPPVNWGLATVFKKLEAPSAATVRKIAVALGALAAFYLVANATLQGRDLSPRTEDECSYVLGTLMLAHGHLWMPMHPLADFFESFFILVRPVYCSIYFPGAALTFVPGVWLGWQSYVMPLILSGSVAALLYRIIAELIDGVAGIVAVVWLVSLAQFRTLSVMEMSHLPMLLLGLLMIWAWLCWRKKQRFGWAALLGVFGGWAAITRPADAVAYALPIGVAVVLALRGQPMQRWIATGALLVAGAAPFLAMQLDLDLHATGHLLQTPYTRSLGIDEPGAEFGIHAYDPATQSGSSLPEKRDYYAWCRPFLAEHQWNNFLRRWFVRRDNQGGLHDPYLRVLADATLPGRVLLILLPLGVLGLMDRRRWVLAATLPAFCVVYLFNPFFLQHYPIVVLPAVMLVVLLGCTVAGGLVPRWSRYIQIPLTIGVLGVATTALWEIRQFMPAPGQLAHDGWLEESALASMNQKTLKRLKLPAVVLFSPPGDFFQEPVYNIEQPWPDDEAIIRAHDLGPRDAEIIRYYAEHQPRRIFYRASLQSNDLRELGPAPFLRDELDHGKSIESILGTGDPRRGAAVVPDRRDG
ncbi:MAG TPA: glycosyltransferase family 39 protein [Tepidisphaeraceae bacterium]|nr:glycosyltransferase family 39 protein [Tepidisphaeraceae bacterium]